MAHFEVVSPQKISQGDHVLGMVFDYDGGYGLGGTATLMVDGEPVAQGRIGATVPSRFSLDESFDVGLDTGTAASPDYQDNMPNKFTGKHKVVSMNLYLIERDHELS